MIVGFGFLSNLFRFLKGYCDKLLYEMELGLLMMLVLSVLRFSWLGLSLWLGFF